MPLPKPYAVAIAKKAIDHSGGRDEIVKIEPANFVEFEDVAGALNRRAHKNRETDDGPFGGVEFFGMWTESHPWIVTILRVCPK